MSEKTKSSTEEPRIQSKAQPCVSTPPLELFSGCNRGFTMFIYIPSIQ